MTGPRLLAAGLACVAMAALAGLASAAHQGEGASVAVKAGSAAAAGEKPAAKTSGVPAPATVSVKREGDRVQLRVAGAASLAAFRRGGAIWLAWDAPSTFDVRAIERAGKGMIESVRPVDSENATVLRFATAAGVAARVDRSSDVWTVELLRQETALAGAPAVRPVRAKDGSSAVAIRAPGLRGMLKISDPEVGDQIVIAPAPEAGFGVALERSYAQFTILASWQGLAIVPSADQVTVRQAEEGIEIAAEGGLALSPEGGAPRVRALAPDTKLFAFEAWRRQAAGPFTEGSQALAAAAAFAKPSDRNKARLSLAQYKFAHGFPTEALAILEVIGREDPAYGDRPDVTMLRGACRLLVGDLEHAQRDLGAAPLAGVREASLWRAALAAENGDANAALHAFAHGVSFLPGYPAPYKTRLSLAAAESALAVGDVDQAQLYLDIVARAPLTETERNRIAIMRGRILQLSEREEEAFALWNAVRKGHDQRNVVRATLASVDLGLAKGKLAKDEAIHELEPARYAWRGDDLEFRVLKTLGRLYLDVGEPRKGLEALRTATIHFPSHKESGAVAREMSDAFATLFRDGAFEKMPIVSAIALYNDFGELTPAGAEGDVVMTKLIERMAALDLLDQAAALVDRRMGSLPTGESRARLGAQLAELRLNDQKPQAALAALEASHAADLPAELRLRRTIVGAKALAASGRSDAAAASLHDEDGIEAMRLRAEIVWRSGQWGPAAQAYRTLLAQIKPADGKVADADAQAILKGAIALAFSQDAAQLDQLRAQFGPAMAESPYRQAFEVVTARHTKAELRAVLDELGDTSAFKGILAARAGSPVRQAKASP